MKLPVPDAVRIEGMRPGETASLVLVYELGKQDDVLAAALGDAFAAAKAASTDGMIRVDSMVMLSTHTHSRSDE
jgi:hypothetical protein